MSSQESEEVVMSDNAGHWLVIHSYVLLLSEVV